jgi:DNA-binding protein H-NS
MKNLSLKGMTFDDLVALRDNVEGMISRMASAVRADLQEKLARVERFVGGKEPKRRKSSLKGRKAEAKYRDPESGLTWAGRGATPRWLRAYVQQGQKKEDFAIAGAAPARAKGAAKKSGRKPGRKAKKA